MVKVWPGRILTEGEIFHPRPRSRASFAPVPSVAIPPLPFSPVKFSGADRARARLGQARQAAHAEGRRMSSSARSGEAIVATAVITAREPARTPFMAPPVCCVKIASCAETSARFSISSPRSRRARCATRPCSSSARSPAPPSPPRPTSRVRYRRHRGDRVVPAAAGLDGDHGAAEGPRSRSHEGEGEVAEEVCV